MRSVIALLLIVLIGIGGCDRQSAVPEQANDSLPVAANAVAVNEAEPVSEEIGTLDRSHAGEAAPTDSFLAPDGDEVTMASFRGAPVLVNLWATWCAPCVAEMSTLETLAGDLQGKVKVLTIAQDLGDRDKVAAFIKRGKFKHLGAWHDDDSGISMGMGANLPTTILYDSQGREVWRMSGGMDWTSQTARDLVAEAQ